MDTKTDNPLDAYIAELLKESGTPDTDEARADLSGRINDAIDQALLEALPLKQLDELEAAVKEDKVDEGLITRLLEEAGVSSEQVIKSALDQFKSDYVKGEA